VSKKIVKRYWKEWSKQCTVFNIVISSLYINAIKNCSVDTRITLQYDFSSPYT
jgi:hypothetical protein